MICMKAHTVFKEARPDWTFASTSGNIAHPKGTDMRKVYGVLFNASPLDFEVKNVVPARHEVSRANPRQ